MRAPMLYTALLCAALLLPAGTNAAHAQTVAQTEAETQAEKATFGAQVREYLLENPQVIIEAMNILQARQDEAEGAQDAQLVQANQDALLRDGASWVGGNPDGDITIVEFTDYRCGYCRKAFSEIEQLIKTDGNIRFIVKEFPILGEASMISSQFAIAVHLLHGPAAYKAAHDGLITLRGEPDTATLSALAKTLGFDAAPILAEMDGPRVAGQIAANHALGSALNISGTPTFVVGSQLLRGYLPLEDMQQVVANERG